MADSLANGGDAVAQELKYHPACLAAHCSRERAFKIDQYTKRESLCTKDACPIAFSELGTYTNEANAACVDNDPLVFQLADLYIYIMSSSFRAGWYIWLLDH